MHFVCRGLVLNCSSVDFLMFVEIKADPDVLIYVLGYRSNVWLLLDSEASASSWLHNSRRLEQFAYDVVSASSLRPTPRIFLARQVIK